MSILGLYYCLFSKYSVINSIFKQFSFLFQIVYHREEYSVDELSAFRGAVAVGNLDVLVHCHGHRDGREVEKFRDGGAHYYHVHEGQTLGIPLLLVDKLVDVAAVGAIVLYGVHKELATEAGVFIILEFRE